jgi:hypothetical protein
LSPALTVGGQGAAVVRRRTVAFGRYRIDGGKPLPPASPTLLKNFDNLMQGSGIVTGRTSRVALQAFLSNALPDAKHDSGVSGSQVDATA